MFGFIKMLVSLIIGVVLGYVFQPQIAKLLNSDEGKQIVENVKEKVDETTQKAKNLVQENLNK
jgi:uncharacterized membrane-anchored protein YhcB (DUF1043 family)